MDGNGTCPFDKGLGPGVTIKIKSRMQGDIWKFSTLIQRTMPCPAFIPHKEHPTLRKHGICQESKVYVCRSGSYFLDFSPVILEGRTEMELGGAGGVWLSKGQKK
ncbi:predicted protein [Histoplasma capsulatum G186AR]|uniref:Uncharacterized protein n=1 Tax=Ajellomyces capsulatus (strain G186AR / H82 / ATCC MYA-2454 / RMSCC 2432) TaxID=447093 RepID=C0NC68_AJECG|nr:uncharacterized protein HCBG_00714 [Histoplasma capsulatum G186AR]EEH11259.1 predicted protein [Histoplasma capsulatum G186AR]